MKHPLILLHGALGSMSQFKEIAKLLSDGYDVHAFNFEGHGGSELKRAFRMTSFSDNLGDYMNENAIDRAHLFGYSMGGYVALTFALAKPERILSITSYGTKLKWDKATAVQQVKMLDPDIIEEKVPAFADHLKSVHGHDKWRSVLNHTAEMMSFLGEGAGLSRNDFKSIKNRVVIGIGDRDRMVSIDESKDIAQILPNGRMQRVTDGVHELNKMDPQLIVDFLTEAVKSDK